MSALSTVRDYLSPYCVEHGVDLMVDFSGDRLMYVRHGSDPTLCLTGLEIRNNLWKDISIQRLGETTK